MASEFLDDADAPVSARMAGGVRFRLSVMMFLQFFIWGAWFEIGFSYIPNKLLGFTQLEQNLCSGRSMSGHWSPCSSAPSSPIGCSPPRSSWPSAT